MAMPMLPSVAGDTGLLEHLMAPEFLCRRYLDTGAREERELGRICSEALYFLSKFRVSLHTFREGLDRHKLTQQPSSKPVWAVCSCRNISGLLLTPGHRI